MQIGKESVFLNGNGHWEFEQASVSIWAAQIGHRLIFFGGGRSGKTGSVCDLGT